jgi:serine/threonine protein phosphatase PrpC
LTGSPLPAAADRLIERALDQGARDNVSAVVVEYAK